MKKRGELLFWEFESNDCVFYGHDLTLKEILNNTDFQDRFSDMITKSEEIFRKHYPRLELYNRFCRVVIASEEDKDEYGCERVYIYCKGPTRGAMPITFIKLYENNEII
ncbi:MAG: hypothetical protein EAX96_20850 [Candidatus Lokiarchaeota archaeon]|nr:hypothetical protein [Candidatus Lokiarchaeota archaeon]